MNVVNTILIIVINSLLLKYLWKGGIKNILWTLIPVVILITLNSIIEELTLKITLILLFYSYSLLVLYVFSKVVESRLKVAYSTVSTSFLNKYKKFKQIVITLVFPIMTTIFQLLLIWNSKIQSRF